MRETYLTNRQRQKPSEKELLDRRFLGRTLRSISLHGPSAFYSGNIADALINEINRQGGSITKQDFENYKQRT